MDAAGALVQGETFHKAGDFARAEQAYRAVLKADPENPRAWFLLGAVFPGDGPGRGGDPGVLHEAIRLEPVDPRSWNLLGVVLATMGRAAEAERCFRSVLQIHPGHAEAARNLERARRHRLMQPGDESAFLPSVGELANPVAYCCGRAYALCVQERFAEAESLYRQALAIRPDSADALNDLGKLLVLQSRTEEAADCFLRAIAVKPDHARAHLNLAAAFFALNRLDRAEPAARRAVQIEPGNPSAWNNLGLILIEIGRPTEAEASFREGAPAGQRPCIPTYIANLAQSLVMQGRAAEAQPSFAHAARA